MKRIVSICLLFLMGILTGCGKETVSHQEHLSGVKPDEKRVEDLDIKGLTMESIQKEGKMQELTPGTVQITAERQQLIGIKMGTVEMRPLEKVIRTVGRVDFDERKVVTISSKTGGWIEELYVDFTGRFVRQGEPLLTLYSPELVSAQEEYLIALRAKGDLMKSSFPEVAASGNSLADSAKRRLKLWDVSDDQIKALEESGQPKKTITLYAPYGGFVLEKMAYKGMNVMPGMSLFKLADLSTVWLYADLYEYDLPFIRPGQLATIQLSYLPGETLTGHVTYIYPSLNPETRTAKVRFEFPNPQGRLKPEMFAHVEIKVPLGRKLVVPEGAVIDTGMRQMVIVDKGDGYFEPREVKVGAKVDHYYEVLRGLKVGERVVTSANFLIDSESRLKEAVGAMGHAH
ncbi:MAG: efflux RND transporter periplasmic adaptor subunit [Desulfobacterota bacterium]|nr:efflux RND transporter periplasmic adaptor subunit [Thermodesulfobacteriota bacterium]